MKIAFVWTGFTSYMADCWRELTSRDGVELRIWVEEFRKSNTCFNPEKLMRGLDYRWKFSDEIDKHEQVKSENEIVAFAPDVIFICGWARNWPPYLAKSAKLKSIPKVLCCDMPWEWKIRKFAARFILRRLLQHFRKIMMPGKRAAMYGRWLGFRSSDIIQGEYGIDTGRFVSDPSKPERSGFVFAGRLVAAKDIRTLSKAYRMYRSLGGDWPLNVYGIGEEKHWLEGVDGVVFHGFAQPESFPHILANAGAFVIASKWDPWPLVILESCAAGLPVICTKQCWNRYELIRENGRIVNSGDIKALARAMLDVKKLDGEKGRPLAAQYSKDKWVERVLGIVDEIRVK